MKFKNLQKRIVCMLLALLMVFTALPMSGFIPKAQAADGNETLQDYDANSRYNVTITVRDENRNAITGATITVTSSDDTFQVVEVGSGQYKFTKKNNYSFVSYTIVVSADGYETNTVTMNGRNTSVSVTLEEKEDLTVEKLATFKVFYIATGILPNSYAGSGNSSDYGPSGNDTPLVMITVDINKLRQDKYASVVVYKEDTTYNVWEFTPNGAAKDMTAVKAFWAAVWDCMTEESREAFEDTGFANDFFGYVLKLQRSGNVQHCDGVLMKDPPVYVIELYDQGTIFGGTVTDGGDAFKEMSDLQQMYEEHLGVDITWTSETTGTYFSEGRIYTINLTQTNEQKAQKIDGSKIPYENKNSTNTYYLATFNATILEGAEGYHTVTYTDGVDSEQIFADQVKVVGDGSYAPSFEGIPQREGYHFLGWMNESTGDILTNEQIASMTVKSDLSFHAVWEAIPTSFTGTVNVLLNDLYPTDIDTLMNANTVLYVSLNGESYKQLEKTGLGVYTAELANGIWYLYYSNDGQNFVKVDDGALVINNAPDSRSLQFYSVSYNLDGGTTASVIPAGYFIKGTKVEVTGIIPSKAGNRFMGWKTRDSLYQPESILTDSISGVYTLVALWEKTVNVTIQVTIDHQDGSRIDSAETKDDVYLELVSKENSTAPYLETGKKLTLNSISHTGFDYRTTMGSGETAGTVVKTQYVAESLTFMDMPGGTVEYFVTASKTGYDTTVTAEQDGEGNWTIYVLMEYDSETFDLTFSVKADASIPSTYLPKAAIVKVTYWNGTQWVFISPHTGGEPGVRVDIDPNTRTGTGSYPVWKKTDSNDFHAYRIIVSAFVYPDETIVSAKEITANTSWGDKVYNASLNVTGGALCGGLNGAYYSDDAQQGTLNATITMDLYDVTFDAMGGTVNSKDQQTEKNQYKIPVLSGYVPVRDGGYIFDGWYTKNGSVSGDWGDKAVSGTDLSADITLYAKWKDPIKVTGTVYVAGSYELDEQIHIIHDVDRTKTVMILLRKQGESSVFRTVKVNITYGADHIGVGTYSFEGLPDDGTVYYIEEQAVNYSGSYINEPESLTVTKDFNKYTAQKNVAVLNGDKTAHVHAYLDFAPSSFDLQYSVDASAIGSTFRPTMVEVLVTYDADHTIVNPAQWPVISQMVFGTNYNGKVIILTAGKGSGSTSVWSSFPDGNTLYDYGIRLDAVTGAKLNGYTNAPYTITYQAPAHQVSGGQSKELIAVVTPNQYGITYVLGVDSSVVSGMNTAPEMHVWSYDTDLSGVIPERYGYVFLGWYDNEECTGDPVTKIDAAVAEDITLYAKWHQMLDSVDLQVTINHTTGDSGEAGNYNKNLIVQLTHAKEGTSIYEDVVGQSKIYGKEIWHTLGDDADEESLQVSQIFKGLAYDYAYSLNVSLDGYYVESKTVTEVVDPDTGATTYQVAVTLNYKPDLLNFSFSVEMAPGIDKSLWPVSAEVKVTCWYDPPNVDIGLDWNVITQHESSSVTVMLDNTGKGTGSYPVWQWLEKSAGEPYYYRIEIVSLHLSDGSIVMTNGTGSEHDVVYFGGDYSATIETENGVVTSGTTLAGAYGKDVSGVLTQVGEVKAVISIDRWKDDPSGDHETDGDQVDDHKQAMVQFRSEDETKGTVNGALSQIFTLTVQANGSYSKVITPSVVNVTANTAAGYVFSHWTNEAGEKVNPFQQQTVQGGQTSVFIAHWKYNEELSYTVKYLEMGTNKVLKADKIVPNITFGTQIIAANERAGISGYVFDYAKEDAITIGMGENVLILYYATDKLDDADDNEVDGDGIADYKQAVIKFTSSIYGSVNGKTTQVITLTDVDADGMYTGSVTPEMVTISANTHYVFKQWQLPSGAIKTEEDAPYVVANKLAVEGGKTYLYTVSWKARTYQYQVQYLDKGTNEVLATGVTKDLIYDGTVQTETAIDIVGYHIPSGESSVRTLAYADGQVIVFYYEKNTYKLTVNFVDIETDRSLHVSVEVKNLPYKSEPSIAVLRNLATIPGYSYVESDPASITILDPLEQGNRQNEITLKYRKNKYDLTVLYYYDGILDASKTKIVPNIAYATQIGTVWSHTGEAVQSGINYALDKITGNDVEISDNADLNVIHVYYLTDTLVDNTNSSIVRESDGVGDGIPDIYQATVTYEVINGSWNNHTETKLNYVFTLYQKEYNGTWSKISNVCLDNTIPTARPASGFTGEGVWYPAVPDTRTEVLDDAAYVLVYMEADTHVITVKVVNGSVTVDGVAQSDKTFAFTVHDMAYSNLDVDQTVLIFTPDAQHMLYAVTVNGMPLSGQVLTGGRYAYTIAHDGDYHITVDFEQDAYGEDKDHDGDWDEPDGIPDKYQKRINYQIVNGYWNGTDNGNKHIYVTLMTDGVYDVHGTAQITDPYLATKVPAAGYVASSGAWVDDVGHNASFPITVSGLQEETFIYRYTEKQKVTVIIEVVGGTSYPRPSTTVYEYSTNETTIEFIGNANHILTSATVNGSVIPLTEGKYYTHDYTQNVLHIKVVYKQDQWKDDLLNGNDSESGGDNTPDEQQALVQFRAEVNGSVTGAITQVYTLADDGSGNFQGEFDLANVIVNHVDGYKLLYWRDTAGNTYTNEQMFSEKKTLEGGKSYIYTAVFGKDAFSYRVEYYFDGVLDITKTQIFDGVLFETQITWNPANRAGDQNQYMLETVVPARLTISHVSSDNVIKVYYVTDQLDDVNDKETGGDNIPDYQQAVIRFASNGNGTVSGTVIQVFTLTKDENAYDGVVVPSMVMTNPSTGYKFSHWMQAGVRVNPYQPTMLFGGQEITYTAQFVKDSFGYRVEYYYDGVLTKTESGTKQEFESLVTVNPAQRDGNFMLEKVLPASLQISADEYENVIRIYYTKDVWNDDPRGNDSTTDGDGIPDYQQVLVTFIPGDIHGTVKGTGTTQVFTFTAGATSGNVKPVLTGVTAVGNSGYAFDYWTRDNLLQHVNPGEILENVAGGTEIVFKAHFAEDIWRDSEMTSADDADSETGGDNIPDKYQAIVTYIVENGTWSDGTVAQRKEIFSLYGWNSAACQWIKRNVTLGDTVPEGMNPLTGYTTPGYWEKADTTEDDPVAETLVTQNTAYTYCYGERMKFNITVTVENGQVTPNQTTIQVTYGEDQTLSFQPNAGYALDYVLIDGAKATLTNGTYTFTDVVADHSIHVAYSVDNWKDAQQTPADDADSAVGGDGIPDYRQAMVSFASGRNGTVEGTILYVVTLTENNGAYVGQFIANKDDVFVKANEGYKFAQWTLTKETRIRAASGNSADPYAPLEIMGGCYYLYTAQFIEEIRDVTYPDAEKDSGPTDNKPDEETVQVQSGKYIHVDPNGGIWNGSSLAQDVKIDDANKVLYAPMLNPVRTGYVFVGWKCTAGSAGSNVVYVLVAQWDTDEKGNVDSDGKDIPDGIPDKYQKKVIFKVVNGYWSNGMVEDIVLWLTLLDENGNWDENGSAKFEVPSGMYARNGYSNGAWEVVPPAAVKGTVEEIYTYRFSEDETSGDNPNTSDIFADGLRFCSVSMLMSAVLMAFVRGYSYTKKRKTR